MAWMTVPTGMLRSGRLLPGLMSATDRSRPCRPAQLARRDDVALLAVGVVEQRDARGAVGVVLDVSDLGRHAVLVVATEVDEPVGPLVPATLVPGRDPPWLLRPPLLCSGRTSDFSGWSRVISTKSATLEPRRPGRRLVLADAHGFSVLSRRQCARSGDRTSEDLDAGRRRPIRWRAWCPCACRSRRGCACACPGG